MDVALIDTAASGLPGLFFVGWAIVAVITYAATRTFLERLRIELH